MSEYSYYSEPDKAAVYAKARAVANALTAAGVVTVRAEYSGTGDEGFVDKVDCLGPGDVVLSGYTAPPVSEELLSELDASCSALLFSQIGVWYDGEGGFGVLRWDLATGTIALDHAWYEQTTVDDPHSFTLGAP